MKKIVTLSSRASGTIFWKYEFHELECAENRNYFHELECEENRNYFHELECAENRNYFHELECEENCNYFHELECEENRNSLLMRVRHGFFEKTKFLVGPNAQYSLLRPVSELLTSRDLHL